MAFQQTIKKPVAVSGIGLHTGVKVTLRLVPAPAGTGIVFRRVDLEGFEVEAHARNIARVSYATSLMKKGVLISTTEHLLATLYAFGIDNVYAELDSLEVPILDGSARPFVEMLEEAGRQRQRRRRGYLQMIRPVEIVEGDRRIAIHPAGCFDVHCTIDFSHPLVGRQELQLEVNEDSFIRVLAEARTFGFMDDVERLRRVGLIRGGSLENAIVLTRTGLLNGTGLRFPDEFCRHKALDLIGDLALLGKRLIGHVEAYKAGHAMHTALVIRLLRDRSLWREVKAVEPSFASAPRAQTAPILAAE